MSPVRIFVVDDHDPFRRFVCSTLAQRPDLQIIGEASDGLEAVQKAEELQPDLIVLDIGLPTLNGIEAARRIRKLAPQSKILFLSQESSPDVVQEAFSLGALGYAVKAHAGSELLAAVEAVRQGRRFVSRGVVGHSFTESQALDRLRHEEAPPSLVPEKAGGTHGHAVQFYSDDAFFLDDLTRLITAAVKANNTVIVVATEPHRVGLLQRLQAGGGDVAAAVEQELHIPLNVADTLSTFLVNGSPDPVPFAKVASDLIVEAAKAARREHRHLVAY